MLEYGVGGLNIDECRVPMSSEDIDEINNKSSKNPTDNYNNNEAKKYGDYKLNIATTANEKGRFPANVILTYDETDYDEVCGGFPNTSNNTQTHVAKNSGTAVNFNGSKEVRVIGYNGNGSASRYFYCAKASKKDRDEGLDDLEDKKRFQQGNYSQSPVCSVCGKTFNGTNDHSLCGEHTMVYKSKDSNKVRKNVHPTVKPTELMQCLVRLVTPNGGTVLDPFNGSGSTGKATMYENVEKNKGYKYIGIELTEEYLPISKARIEYASNQAIEKCADSIKKSVEKCESSELTQVGLW